MTVTTIRSQFDNYLALLPATIAAQVAEKAWDSLIPVEGQEVHKKDKETIRRYERRFLLILLASCSGEIGFDLWWQGNQLYGELREK